MSSRLILEEISEENYREFHDEWGDDRIFRQEHGYAKIVNPIIEQSYELLIRSICDFPNFFKLNVRAGRTWRHFHQNELGRKTIERVARLAESDYRGRNFFEADFRINESDYRSGAIIEFIEEDKLIVGYKLHVHIGGYDLFRIRGRLDMPAINALADPYQGVTRLAPPKRREPPAYQRKFHTG